jgi:hypothetical protein
MSCEMPQFSKAIWYLGKGIDPNMYVKYAIDEQDTDEGRPFNMTIWFKDFDPDNKYWIAPVTIVNSEGNVINATFHLSDLDASVLQSSEIPSDMLPYKEAYQSSLLWLSAFVPKPGQPLNADIWGKTGGINGQPIRPNGMEKITVPAGSFDTTVVVAGKNFFDPSLVNKIWIKDGFPYPVKASTFADIAPSEQPKVKYEFELLDTGEYLSR